MVKRGHVKTVEWQGTKRRLEWKLWSEGLERRKKETDGANEDVAGNTQCAHTRSHTYTTAQQRNTAKNKLTTTTTTTATATATATTTTTTTTTTNSNLCMPWDVVAVHAEHEKARRMELESKGTSERGR